MEQVILSEYIESHPDFYIMSFSKLDEIFAQLIEDEIYEVRVTRKEILFITRWVIRNTSLSDVTPILTGAVDMFLGVKLIKIDEPSQRT